MLLFLFCYTVYKVFALLFSLWNILLTFIANIHGDINVNAIEPIRGEAVRSYLQALLSSHSTSVLQILTLSKLGNAVSHIDPSWQLTPAKTSLSFANFPEASIFLGSSVRNCPSTVGTQAKFRYSSGVFHSSWRIVVVSNWRRHFSMSSC